MSDEKTEITDPKQLTTIYKKNGAFDKQRKVLLEDFKKSETHANLLLKLKLMVESKIRQDSSILMKNRGKMGALIQGEIINERGKGGGLLSIVDKDIQDKIIDSPEFHQALKNEIKEIRRQLLGISDEEYEKQLEEEKKQELEKQENKEVPPPKKNRITKAPRFNFHKSYEKDNYKSDSYKGDSYKGDNYKEREKKDDDKNNGKSVPFLMY